MFPASLRRARGVRSRKHRARTWQVGKSGHRPGDFDLAAERLQVTGESVGDLLCAAARERPSDGVASRAEHQSEGGGRRCAQWQKRMPSQAGE